MGNKCGIILDQSLDNFYNSDVSKKRSYDIKDFDLDIAQPFLEFKIKKYKCI